MYSNTNFIRFNRKMTIFAVVLAMCSILIQGVTVSAEDILFNLSGGAIRIESGTSPNTIKVIQGGVTKDNLPEETQVTITGTYYGTISSEDVIYIAPNVTTSIKLNNINISFYYTCYFSSAFNIDGGNVTLELIGENVLQSGVYAAGLRVSETASLVINGGGSLVASGGNGGAAGIGGNSYNHKSRSDNCGTITINSGTITAQGGSHSSAGIGGGYQGSGGKIIINGGTVKALENSGSNSKGIGNGGNSGDNLSGGTLTMNGNAVVFATSISDDSPKTQGILFIGNNGVMYGNVTLEHDVTISNNMTLALHKGELIIAKGAALTNNGTIILGEGTSVLYGGDTYGILTGIGQIRNMVTIAEILGVAAPVPGATPATTITETSQYTGTVKWLPAHNVFQKGTSYTATITLTAKHGFALTCVPANFFTVAGTTAVNSAGSGVITAAFSATDVSNSIFDITGGAIRIEKGTNTDTFKVLCGGSLVKDNISKETQVTITGSCSNISGDGIYVAPGVTANIMLCNANINSSCAFNMSGAIVNLELVGENTLGSNDSSSAGLHVPVGASVTVYGEGKLTVNGSGWGAGIGGNSGESGGNITLNNGMLTVNGGSFGAGIGGGANGSGGNITINNGTISATSGNTAAGIGGGDDGTAGTIIINGGIITANGGSYGPGIGNDFYGTGKDVGSVTINGGMISVNSIGNGVYNGQVCSIAINGGTVSASRIGGAGGSGSSSDIGSFTMNGNAVVIASYVSDNSPKAKGILFNGNSGVMYGNVTVEQDLTIPNNRILALRAGTLTIAKGVTLTNNGIIVLGEGSSILNGGDIYGTLAGSGKTQNMVSIPEIKGVPAPVPGEVPVTIVTESSHYTGTVQWSPAHKVFQAGVGYTATITLTAKPYFVFTGVPANFFTLIGASSVKNNADSGVVTAVFSATDAKNNCFDLSDGPIRVENGSSFNTMKIKYGKGLVKDYLSQNTPITITGNYLGDSNSTVDAIYVSQAANIKMNNVNISVNASNRSAFNIDGGSVTLELIGENILKSGSSAAGLRVSAESSLTINGNGSLTSTGGSGGAGIGGNSSEACGAVTINGGVITTQGGSYAMGIGGGSGSSNGGTLTMNGDAIVFVSSLSDNSPKTKGILFNGNSGMMYGDVTVEHDVTISNNMRLVLNTGTLTIAAGNTITNNGIILLGEGTSVLYSGDTYGTLTGSGQTQNMVTIKEILGVEAPVPGAVPVTTITETSQYTGTVKWLPAHSQFKEGTSYTATITLTAKSGFVFNAVPANFFKVPGATALNSADSGVITALYLATDVPNNIFDITEGVIKVEHGTNANTVKVTYGNGATKDNIPRNSPIIITGNYTSISSNRDDAVYVASGVTANICLVNVNINLSNSYSSAFNIDGGHVNLELCGENVIRTGWPKVGMNVPEGASVTISGSGSLDIAGNARAAIGTDRGENVGNITINGGTIIAKGGTNSAGISSTGGTVTINGGMVTATCGGGSPNGAGIGGDGLNSAGNLIVTGGIVNATGYAGIGSCQYAESMGTFTLNGNGIVFTNSVRTNVEGIKGILFIGNSGTVYGNVTLEENTTIPSSRTLTIPNSSSLLIPEDVTLTNNGTVTPSNGSTMTVSGLVSGKKIDGANVTALSANRRTHNSVTLNAADLLAATGQSVEYAFSTSNFVPSSGWQNTPYFTALNPDTTYYFFARSREDTNFRAGMTSSLPVTTQWAGDINQDNVINMVDVMEIAKVFNTNSTSEKFNPACDLNRDNSINMVDIMILAAHFNQIIK